MARGVTVRFMRATVAGNEPPANLEQGELAIDALNDPPRLWTGVPLPRDPSGRIDLIARAGVGSGMIVAVSTTPPSSPNEGELWFNSVSLMLFIRYEGQWVSVGGGGAPIISPPATQGDLATAISGALEDYALIDSQLFTGTPSAPTPTAGDISTRIATTAFVTSGGYAAIDSQEFTGEPAAPTAPVDDDSTRLATTAFTQRAMGPLADEPGPWTLINLDIAAWYGTILYRTINGEKSIQMSGRIESKPGWGGINPNNSSGLFYIPYPLGIAGQRSGGYGWGLDQSDQPNWGYFWLSYGDTTRSLFNIIGGPNGTKLLIFNTYFAIGRFVAGA